MASDIDSAVLATEATRHGGEPPAVSVSRQGLFVIPNGRGDGFHGSIRGHLLELADPNGLPLAPTPDDLLVASIASDLAWFVRGFLRARELDDYVSVSAGWPTLETPPETADLDFTVTVGETAAQMEAALAAALELRLAARWSDPPRIQVRQA
jgi:hypothetical protein